ncbi:MAG: fatty acid hydroxylase [Chlorobi bacterium]|nr:fatty acid hydroxylase [Chlorobiota bacterium]
MPGVKKPKKEIPDWLRPRAQGQCDFHTNPTLNRIARTPIWLPWAVYLPIIAVIVGFAIFEIKMNIWSVIALFLLGWFTWTITEYIVHRFLYHTETDWEWLRRIQDRGHGIHHRHPKDPYCLAMPPIFSIFLAAGLFVLFYYLLKDLAFAFYGGFVFGYLVYLLFHWAQHRLPKRDVPKFLQPLWEHHVIHHYKDPDVNFGVSTRLWDFLFRTTHEQVYKEEEQRNVNS